MYLSVQGKQYYYHRSGRGPALLLLHGFMEDHSMWTSWVSQLESYFTCVVTDIPGHGRSNLPAGAITLNDLSQPVAKIMEAESLPAFHVLGHSMGGYLGLALARNFPDKVLSVALLNSTAAADSIEKQHERDRVIQVLEMNAPVFIREAIPNLFAPDMRTVFKKDIDTLIQIALSHKPVGLIAAVRAMRDRPDMQAWIKEALLPIHFIIGAKDTVLPMSAYQPQLDAGTHITSFISDKAAHMSHLEDELAVMTSLSMFYQKILQPALEQRKD